MIDLLNILLPVFLLIILGYLAVIKGLFQDDHISAMMRFAQSIALPCLLFLAVSTLDLRANFDPKVLTSYYVGALSCFLFCGLIARFFLSHSPGASVAIGFCGFFSNTVLLGLPIVERAYGAENLAPAYTVISIHVPMGYFLGISVMEMLRANGAKASETVRSIIVSLFSNGIFLGLLLGFFVNITGLMVPKPLLQVAEMLKQVGLPLALFCLGGVLTRYRLADQIKEISVILIFRQIVHPIIVYGLGTGFGLENHVLFPIVLVAAMAPGINVYLFANIYDRATAIAASSVLVGTVISFFSLSFWIAFLGPL